MTQPAPPVVDPAAQPPTEPPKADPPAESTDWKSEARKWEQRAKENREAAAKLAEIEAANATDLEKAVKKASDETRSEVEAKANARIVRAEARALAATAKFRDPADAVAFLDLSAIKVDDNGDPDADAIKAALKALGASKPYLIDEGKPGKPQPDPGQGGGGGKPMPGSAGKAEAEKRFGSKQ